MKLANVWRLAAVIVAVTGLIETPSAKAQSAETNLAVTVRHAPSLGSGNIQGSLQELYGESFNVSSGFNMTGDLSVPGTPTIVSNGSPGISGIIVGSGSTMPTGYKVTLSGSIRYLRTRTTPVSISTVSAPPTPTGTRNVTISSAGQSYGDPTTLRNLNLGSHVGIYSIPPGTYGSFTVNSGSGLILGVADSTQPTIYNLQSINFNSDTILQVVGPVVLTLANGFTANSLFGATNNPAWLQLRIASGGVTMNTGSSVYALVLAPNGNVNLNTSSLLVGTSASDQFTLNGGTVRWASGSITPAVQPPVATNQSIILAENSSTNLTLTGADPQGLTLSYAVLTQPAHGTLSGTPPNLTYYPATNYYGSDSFTFNVNNGTTNSAPATVSLAVTQVYYPPLANSQSLTNLENTALSITLTGSDAQGYALAYSVLAQPNHGTLSGTAPDLTYLPATNYYGNDSFTFLVNDGVSNSFPATISITNQPVDYTPTVTAGANQTIILPANMVNLAGTVAYANFPGTVDTVLWTQVNGPGTVAFDSPSTTATAAHFSTNGVYQLRLFASDSFMSASNDLYVTVDAPPSVSAGADQTNTFPGTITLQGSVSDDGLPANGKLTAVWSAVSGPGTVIFADATLTNTAVTFGTNGIYVLRLTADDGIATNSAEVTIIENAPPAVSAGTGIMTNGLQAMLTASVSDDGLPGGSVATQWSQSSGPGNVTFVDASATNTAVTASQSGTYLLTLTATDGAATNSSAVAVTFNLPPTANAGMAQTVNWGTAVALAGSVTDDGLPYNTLHANWTEISGPGTATFADATLTNTSVTFDQPGAYMLQLTADDGYATNSSTVSIGVNAAPVVDAGTNQTVALGSPTVLAGSYTDDGISGQPVTVQWTQVSGPSGASIANPSTANTAVSFSQSGIYVFALTASDGMTNASAQVTVSVSQAPTVTVTTPILMNWPANQAALNGTVTDDGIPVGGTLTATWTQISGPGTVSFSTATQSSPLSGTAVSIASTTTATFSASGVYDLRLTGNDGLASAQADVIVTVNEMPMVNAGPGQIVNFGTTVALAGTASDDRFPFNVLHALWTEVSGPGTATFADAALTNTSVTFDQPGVYALQLTADDGYATNSSTVSIGVNAAPVVDAGTNQTVALGSPAVLAGSYTDDGISGQPVTVQWSQVSGPSGASIANPSTTNTAISFSQSGIYVFAFTASDGMTNASALVTVAVSQAPTVTVTTPILMNWPANQATLNGTVTDDGIPVGGTLTATWSLVSGPGTVSFSTPVQSSPLSGTAVSITSSTTATFSASGVYDVRLTGNDGLASAQADVIVTVNQAPVVTAGPAQTVNFNTVATLAGSVTDDGLPFNVLHTTWTQVSGPGTATFADATLTNSTVTFDQPGTYTLQLTADDGYATNNSTVVIAVNAAPVVSAGTDQTVAGPNILTTLNGTATDDGLPAGSTLVAQWTLVSGAGNVTFGNANATNTTASFDQAGTYVLRLTANDSMASASADVAITVQVPNQPPVVNAGPAQTNLVPAPVQLAGTVTDDGLPAGGALTALWSLVSGPGTATFDDAALTNTTVTFSQPGVYVLQLTASDSQLSGSSQVVMVADLAPVVDAGPSQLVSGTNQVALTGTVQDDGFPLGGTLTAGWSVVSGPGNVTFDAALPSSVLSGSAVTNAIATVATFTQPGVYVLRLTADDSFATGSANVTISLNQAPVVNAGPNQTNNIGSAITLAGNVTDDGLPVGAPLTVAWSQISGPGTLTFANAHSTNTTVTASQGGVYTVRLTADDTLATNTSDLTIRFNLPPVAQAQSLTIQQGQSVPITLTGTDPDGDPITFALASSPASGSVSGTPPNVVYTPATNFYGQDSFTFVANDGMASSAPAQVSITVSPTPRSRTYTTDADFMEGTYFKSSILITNDQVQLRSRLEAFHNLWVANSQKGTIIRIDTDTGEIKGEYKSAPDGEPLNPSRTTVDLDGSVWAANRNGDSVVHITVPESGLWTDRNTNGVLDTSSGLGDVLPWTNTNGVDSNGGVSSAQDELIEHYVKVRSYGTRHVSVDANNDVWVSGTSGQLWDLIDGATGKIIRQEPSVGRGGYGGLIDRKGVIWSSRPMMRWDTSKPLNSTNFMSFPFDSYGLGLDSKGCVWVSTLNGSGQIRKLAPDGTVLGTYFQGSPNAQGVAVGLDDDVWVASSLAGGTTVGHLKNDGTFVGTVKVGQGPTGVAVDAKGKIWVANYNSGNVMRIDPTLGPLGADGVTPVGEVDYVSPYLGGNLYNYSDMTGSTLIGFPGNGGWSVVYDSTINHAQWGPVTWNSKIYDDGQLQVTFATSDDGTNFNAAETLAQPNAVPVSVGRYAKVAITFVRSAYGQGPILEDLTLGTRGYNAPLVAPVVNIDAGTNHDLQLPLADVLHAAIWHNGFYNYNSNQVFSWSMVSAPAGGTVSFANSNAATTTAKFSTQGVYDVRVQTTLLGASYSDDLSINAIPINRPPWVDVGGNRVLHSTNDVLHLAATATDDGLPAGSTLTVQWTKVIGPGTVTFSNPTAATNDVTFSAPGIYLLQLTASDTKLSYSAQLEVRVQCPCEVEAPSGIALWWPGNAQTREVVRGDDMYLMNGATFAPAQISYGFSFNGTTNYAKAYAHPALDLGASDSMTVEFWAKGSSSGRLFDWYRNGVYGPYADYGNGGTLTFHLRDTNNLDHVFAVGGALSTSQFQHVALTYDKTTGNAVVYVNGVIAANTNLTVFTPNTTGDFYLAGGLQDTNNHFGGIVDELSMYSRALNGEEVYEIYSAQFIGKCPIDSDLAPVVSAGGQVSVPSPGTTVTLNGSVTDDGLPQGVLYSAWRTVSGPTNAIFGNSNSPITTATFPLAGMYTLQLYADDGEKSATDQAVARVNALCSIKASTDIIGWWTGNDTDADAMGGSPALRINGTSFTNGIVEDCFNFDGLNDFAQIQNSQTYDVAANAAGFTVEFWMKPLTQQQPSGVLGWANGVRIERYTAGGTTGSGLQCDLTGTNAGQYVLSGNVLGSGPFQWTHIAVTYDRTLGQGKIYVNGVLLDTESVGTNLLSTAGDFYLGHVPGSPNPSLYYGGQLDEVSVYRRPLNATEVYSVYAAGSVGKCPADANQAPVVSAGPDQFIKGVPGTATLAGQATDDGLPSGSTLRTAWSQFSGPGTVTFANSNSLATTATFSTNGVYILQLTADDGEAQSRDLVEVRVEAVCTVEDPQGLAAWWSGNGQPTDIMNHLDAILGSGTSFTNGKVAAAFTFNGVNNFVLAPANTNYNVGNSAAGLTVEFWMKPLSQQQPVGVVGWANGVRIERSNAGYTGSGVQCDLTGTNVGQCVVATNVLGVGPFQWTHIAVTYDRTLGQGRIYVNGVLLDTENVGTNLLSTAGDFYLGNVPGSLNPSLYYGGQLDEISLYRRALNPEEVYSLYTSGSVGKCPNDGNLPPTAYAGPDLFVTGIPGVTTLEGMVDDDGLPAGSTLRSRWSVFSGPGTVTFVNSNAPVTMATFSTNGIYVLQLTADDGEAQTSDFVEVRVETLCNGQDPQGLAAWWPANGQDLDVINGYDAILASGTSYTNGEVASAFNFDGVADFALMPAQTNYDIGSSPAGFTVEYWMKPLNQQNQSILGWANGVRLERYGAFSRGDGVVCYLGGTNSGQYVQSGSVLGSGNYGWSHVAVTYNRLSGQAAIFLNGVLMSTASVGTNLLSTAGDFYLGLVPGTGTGVGFYAGRLDEVSLYRRPLNPDEIYSLYSSGSIGKCPADANRAPVVYAGRDFSLDSTNQTASLNGLVTDDGLPVGSILRIGWSVFSGPGRVAFNNSNSPSTTATFSTNGIYVLKLTADDGEAQSSDLTEVRVGLPCPVQDIPGLVDWWPANGTPVDKITGQAAILGSGASYTNGEVASAFNFSGVSNFVWMAAQTNSNFNLGAVPAGFTVEFWMKPFYQQNQCILGWANGVRFERVLNSSWGDGVACYLGGTNSGQYVQSGSVFGSGNYGWYHVAVTFDRALGQGRIYINGALRNTVTVGTNLLSTAGDFYLGQVPGMTSGIALYAGQLDEVSLYNRPLASNEVAAIYNAGSAGKCMTPPNQPPVVSAGGNKTIYFPTNSVTLNGYAYDDGLPSNTLSVVWAYVSGTNAVTFSSLTNAVATITFTNTGSYAFQLAASDGQYTSTDLASVTVLPDPRIPPTVTLTTPATNAVIQAVNGVADLALAATAADADGRITSVSFWLNGNPAGTVTNLPYAFTVSNLPPATYTVTAVATDSDGLSTTSAPVTATIYVDTGAPTVAIFAPADSAIITAPTNIIGTVDSPIVQSYQLQYRMETPDGTNAWVTLTTGTTAVSSNVLGRFDPTLLLNGIYEMRLTASDLLGRTNATDPLTVIVDRNLKVGNFTISFNDLSVAVPGLPIQITRTYDSRAAAAGVQGDFGAGWTMDIRNVRLQKNRPLSRNWDEYTTGNADDGSVAYHLDPGSQRIVTITFPDGRVEKFLFTPDPMDRGLAPIDTPKWMFTPMGNTRGTLLPASYDEPDGKFLQFAGPIPGTEDLDDFNAFWDYVDNFGTSTTLAELQRYPTLFRYTSDAGYVYLIDEIQGLQSVTDPNGNMLVMSTNGLAWQNPAATTNTVSVAFQRDTLGRITNILDLAGNSLSYQYDTNGNLVTFIDRTGNTNWFTYTNAKFPNYLTGIINGLGINSLQNQYDAAGRLIGTTDASGNTVRFGNDLNNNIHYTTNRMGGVTITHYDDHGNVLRLTDPRGMVTTCTYDEDSNLTSVQKGSNPPRVYTYDSHGNRISAADELGRTRYFTYGFLNKVLTDTDTEGNTSTNTYDGSGNLLSTSNPLGETFTFTYDKTGNVLSMTDPQGHVTSYTYDAFGHLASEMDQAGNVTAYLAATDGKLLAKIQDRVQTQTQTQIAASRNVVRNRLMTKSTAQSDTTSIETAELTDLAYMNSQLNALLIATNGPDPSGVYTNWVTYTYNYDASGNLVAMRNNRVWDTNVYNQVGHIISTTEAVTPTYSRVTTTVYNTNGLIESIAHPQINNTPNIEYFTYDANNYLIKHVDGYGRETQYAYDLVGNVTNVIFPDGRTVGTVYNYLGQIQSETDYYGTTTYTYDLTGNRIMVTDPQGRIAQYSYNAKRACTNYVDFAGRTTKLEYDAMNRNTKVTYPDGTTRSATYLGRLVTSITDQLGHVTKYEYGADYTLKSVTTPYGDPLAQTTTYDYSGNVKTVHDPLGLTTTYTYADSSLRDLIQVQLPDGTTRSSTYDLVHRLTSQTDGENNTTYYDYDDADNLVKITAPQCGLDQIGQSVTQMAYDNAHHRTQRIDPQSGANTTTWTYDAAGRLTSTAYPDGSTETLDYDDGGRLDLSQDRMGRETTYGYDSLGRVNQVVTPAATTSFSYDDANNVLKMTQKMGDVNPGIRTTSYSYDAMDRRTKTLFYDGSALESRFDDAGRLVAQSDKMNNFTTYVYDNANRKTSMTDPSNNVTQYIYNNGNQLIRLVDPKQQNTYFYYDAAGRCTNTILPNGDVKSAAFDHRGLVMQSVQPGHGTNTYVYDNMGRVYTITDPLGYTTRNSLYDRMGRLLKFVDAKNQTTSFAYDAMGNRKEVDYPDGSKFFYTYNADRQVTSKQDIYGHITLYTYDLKTGRPESVTDALGDKTAYVNDSLGRRRSLTDALGRTTKYDYDDSTVPRTLRVTHPATLAGQAVETYSYDQNDHLVSFQDARGNTTRYGYDKIGQLISKVDALNQTTAYTYDELRRLVSVTDPAGHRTQFGYDPVGDITTITYPDASQISRTYNGYGQVTSVIDQNNESTSYDYDNSGQLIKVTNPAGVTAYQYDELGRMIKQMDALGRPTVYAYDPMGRRTGRTLPGGESESFTYDYDGNLTTHTDFNNHTTTYGYDAINRLVSETPDGSFAQSPFNEGTISTVYNAVSLRVALIDAAGSSAYAYDGCNQLTNKVRTWSDTGTSASLNYEYDLNGNVTRVGSLAQNGASVGYQYDVLNRLQSVDDGNGSTVYGYNPAGTIDRIVHPNQLTEQVWSDDLNRVTGILATNVGLGQSVALYGCGYDPVGNRTSAEAWLLVNQQWQSVSNTYAYDPLYSLTKETVAINQQLATIGYAYDAVGNRTVRDSTLPALPSNAYAYGSNDTLKADSYDANGNTIAGTILDAQLQAVACNDSYDHADRLVQRTATLNNQPSAISLQYDGDGQRIGKTVNGVTTHFLVDEVNPTGYPQVLEEHTAAGEVSRVYTYGNGPLSQQQLVNGQWQTSYYGRDTHGSVRYLTDATGQVTDNYDYDAFGNVINQSGNTPNTRLFSGEEFDPDLGMEYLRARYRDPQRGRFWTRDSFEGDLADPASRHGYNYCQNNPVNAIDPSGHDTLMEVGMADNIAALMGSALQNLFVGTMSDVYALQENAPAKANSQAEAMMIQSTQQGVGVAGGLQNYWNVMNGVPFLLAANPFVAPTPALTLAPTVLGFDASEPIYGAGLRHAVMEAGYPNASGMIDPTWTLNSGLAVTPAAQRAHEMNFDPQGTETQLAGEINEQSPALAANLAKSLNEANLLASDNRALQILELPKGGIAGPGIEPVALGVIGYTPAAWEPGALKADPLCSDQLMHALIDGPQKLCEEARTLWQNRSQIAVSLIYGASHGVFNTAIDAGHALNFVSGGGVLWAALGYNTDTVLNEVRDWGNQQLGQAVTFYGGDADSRAAKVGEFLPMLIPLERVVAVAARGAEALEGLAVAARGDRIIPGAIRSVEKSNVGRSLVEAEAESLDAGKVASKQVEKECPPGSSSCFVAGTLVATASGLRPIETIQTNEWVWSWDSETGQTNLNPVETTYVRTAPATVTLQIGDSAITSTLDHPFWVVDQGWTLAGQLHPGDVVLTLAGTNTPILSEQQHSGWTTVYNLKVAHDHSYFVSPTSVLVHNANYTPGGNVAENQAAKGTADPLLLPAPAGSSARTFDEVANLQGAGRVRGKAFADYLADITGGEREVYAPTKLGRRFQDVGNLRVGTTEIALEGKNYWGSVKLSPFLRKQVYKDVLWMRAGRQMGVDRIVQWHFANGGPADDLRDLLMRWNINIVE